jgi:RHS repeat-associated protein
MYVQEHLHRRGLRAHGSRGREQGAVILDETLSLEGGFVWSCDPSHWRTVKRTDTASPPDGVLDQERRLYYSAAWQLLEEHIDDDRVSNPGVDRVGQQFWGLRSLDDAVMRRPLDGGTAEHFYYVTDRQFSPVAILGDNARLVERVSYSAYGKATHRFPGDWNKDGVVDSDDVDHLDLLGLGLGEEITDSTYVAEFDLNRDGVVDGDDVLLAESWFGHGGLAAGAISDPAGPGNPIGYTGHVFNVESLLYLARHRTYSPALGRWLTEDPAGEVDGPNLYQYVLGNPLLATDPMGLNREIRRAVAAHQAFAGTVMADFRSGRISGEDASRLINMSQSAAMSGISAAERNVESFNARFTTGPKAVVNAAAGTVVSFATLGTRDWQPIPVSDAERQRGYGLSYGIARVSTEVGFGIATGAASTLGHAGKAILVWDLAGNAFMTGEGIGNMACEGVTWQNSLQVGFGAAGFGGNAVGRWGRSSGKPRGAFIDEMDAKTAARYRKYWQGSPDYPTQGAPFQVKTWHHPDGRLKTVQTYDEIGHAHRQYGLTERNHLPHEHHFKMMGTQPQRIPDRHPIGGLD